MRKISVSTGLLIIITLGALAQSPPERPGDRTGASISAEAKRLKGVLASLKLPDADGAIYASAFNRVERASQSGHVFLSLFLLHPSAATLPAIEYQKAKADVEKGGLEALGWLGEVKQRYGDRVEVVTVAIESEKLEVRKQAQSLKHPPRVVMGTEALAASFGTINSVPTMFVFDREGKTATVFYGAPEDLHLKAERLLNSLLK